jgi:hypothetical protein
MFISKAEEGKKKKVEKTNAIRNTQKQSKTAELCWHLISVLYIVENGNVLKICLFVVLREKFQLHERTFFE